MASLPEALSELIHRLSRLPGIGPRAAERMALAIIDKNPAEIAALADALNDAVARVTHCPHCGCLSQDNRPCRVCDDNARDRSIICVVESPLDSIALEKGGGYHGLYHVLGGAISPLSGVLPEDLRISELLARVGDGVVSELILATNASPEGEATALYIRQELDELHERRAAAGSSESLARIRVTRLARGLPSGSQLDYTDSATLQSALDNRTEL
ncbi:MAG: recombination protein RecR [Planctomycetales bacterium]|nr:recombination protein RecR [bacterium]UNM08911.1 MAG: recombination protein RecR [Planctomycetales bacterium]